MKRTRPVIALIVALGLTLVASLGSVRVLAQECGAQLGEAEEVAPAQARTCRDTTISDSEWEKLVGGKRLVQQIDFDRDGKPDVLETGFTWGSGMGGGTSHALLSSGPEHVAGLALTYYEMIQRDAIPIELLEPEHRAIRRAMENALFRRVCDGEDSRRAIRGPRALTRVGSEPYLERKGCCRAEPQSFFSSWSPLSWPFPPAWAVPSASNRSR